MLGARGRRRGLRRRQCKWSKCEDGGPDVLGFWLAWEMAVVRRGRRGGGRSVRVGFVMAERRSRVGDMKALRRIASAATITSCSLYRSCSPWSYYG